MWLDIDYDLDIYDKVGWICVIIGKFYFLLDIDRINNVVVWYISGFGINGIDVLEVIKYVILL